MHGDEIAFIFGGEKKTSLFIYKASSFDSLYVIMIFFADPFKPKPEALIDYTDEERTLSRTMMTFWANFAKTG